MKIMFLQSCTLAIAVTGCSNPMRAGGSGDASTDASGAVDDLSGLGPVLDFRATDEDLPKSVRCAAVPGVVEGKVWGGVISGESYVYNTTGCILFDPNNGRYSEASGDTFSSSTCTTGESGITSANGANDPSGPFFCNTANEHSLVANITDLQGNVIVSCIQFDNSGTFTATASGLLHLYYNDNVGSYGDNSNAWNACFYGLETSTDMGEIIF